MLVATPPDFDKSPFHEIKYHFPLDVIYVKSILYFLSLFLYSSSILFFRAIIEG